MSKTLTLSVIIPVYNEEYHIKACLEAVGRQIRLFDEVIVVDNNSTDATAKIAKSFPFVKVVKEKKQGLIPARNRGFDEAKGDILCRIDADAILEPNWAQRVAHAFEQDARLSGITGLAYTHVLPRVHVFRTTLYARGYYWWTWYLFNAQVLWGAHMAITREAWKAVGKEISDKEKDIHEDQDLSLCMLAGGRKIRLDTKLLIRTNGQTYHFAPKLLNYIQRAVQTRRLHKEAGRFPLPPKVRLSVWKIIPAAVAVYTLGMIFLIVSLLFWPVDKLMVKLGREKSWLD